MTETTKTLREEIERLTNESDARKNLIDFMRHEDEKLRAENSRLTARVKAADAMRDVANSVMTNISSAKAYPLYEAIHDYDATAPEGTNNECVCGSHEHSSVGVDVHGAHDRGYVGGTPCHGSGNRDETDVVPERGDPPRALRPDGEPTPTSGETGRGRGGSSGVGHADTAEASSVDTATTAPDTASECESCHGKGSPYERPCDVCDGIKIETDKRVPRGEAWIKQGDKVVGKITGLATPDAPRDHNFTGDDIIAMEGK